MAFWQQYNQQIITKFQHSYVRHETLLGWLASAQTAPGGAAHGNPALQYLAAQGSTAGQTQNGRLAGSSSSSSDPFLSSLAAELERLRLFVGSQLKQLWAQLLDSVRQLQALSAARGSGSQQSVGYLHSIELALDALGEEVCLIEKFARQNVMACAQLAQMRDRQPASAGGASEVHGAYLACMEAQLLREGSLDPLLVGLSDAYELLRSLQSHAMGVRAAKWVPPEKFQRLTRKFWLQPADVTRFKCQVIKHLPILIFGDRHKLTEVDISGTASLTEQRELRDSSIVSSVYYDNPESLNSYHTRLCKEDYATAVRVRWYGERSLAGEQQLFVERKTHRNSWSGFFSSKDRAPMQQRFLSGYMAGVSGLPGMDGDSTQAEFLREVQEYVTENQQVPFLRTIYRRTAFQKSSDNIVRVSMDTDMQMVMELGAPRLPGDWCRDMSAPLPPSEVTQFPYAVVEIKLQAKPPEWIKDLVHSGILLPLPRFSKFLHGVGWLYQHLTDQLPNWFLPDETDPALMTPATWEEMADPSDDYLKSAANWLFPASFEAPAPGTSPFSFFSRSKAPPSSPSRPGTNRAAAAATARRFSEFELACERLPEAESSPSESSSQDGSSSGSKRRAQLLLPLPLPQQQQLPSPQQLSPLQQPMPLQVVQPVARGSVQRMQTWPLYQGAVRSDTSVHAASEGFLPPSYAELGFAVARTSSHSVHAVSNPLLQQQQQEQGVAGHGNGPSHAIGSHQGLLQERQSKASSNSTPVDSAQDMELGKATVDEGGLKLEPLPQQLTSLQQRGLTTNAFGSQLYKQLGCGLPGDGGVGGVGEGAAKRPKKGGNRAAAMVRTRVEPKTFFANERTFLSWLQISVLVMMIAFSLLSGSLMTSTAAGMSSSNSSMACPRGDKSCMASKISGAIIAPVALLFMGYSLFMYKKRTIQILRRETVRYDDQRGPVLLVCILLVVLIVAYVVSMVWIF